MHISAEGKIGIVLGLVGLAGAGAIIIAPQELLIGYSLIVLAIIGLIILLIYHIATPRQKPPEIECLFRQDDIGGCVCPHTKLKRENQIFGLPQAVASTAATTQIFRIEPPGTMSITDGFSQPAAPSNPRNEGTYYRVKVQAKNGTVASCRGRLLSLKRGSEKLITEAIDLPFAPSENKEERLNKTIHVGGNGEHLDFLFISDANIAEITPPGPQCDQMA